MISHAIMGMKNSTYELQLFERERERERGVFHSDGVCIYVGVKQNIQTKVHWYKG